MRLWAHRRLLLCERRACLRVACGLVLPHQDDCHNDDGD
jgi:hypothetical protein